MTREKIRELLFEAGTAKFPRTNAIQVELGDATYADQHDEIDTPAAGVNALLNTLYCKMLRENPEGLIALLPVFEIMCGDRPDGTFIA